MGQLQANGGWLPCVNQGYAGLDTQCQLWPNNGKPEIERDMDGKCGEAVAQIPDKGMTSNNDTGRRRLLEPTHGVQSLLCDTKSLRTK